MSFFISRHKKKKEQLKKNKYHQMIFELVRLRREEDGKQKNAQAALDNKRAAIATKSDGDRVWSVQVNEVRDRLTGKKRASKERWNRFAGTESGGARGL